MVQLTARVQGTLKLTGKDEEAKKKVYPGGACCLGARPILMLVSSQHYKPATMSMTAKCTWQAAWCDMLMASTGWSQPASPASCTSHQVTSPVS